MTWLTIFGLLMTLMYLLDYGIKPRQWRKWIGLAMLVSGVFALFRLPMRFNEIDVGFIYMVVCLYGWSLFYSSDRFDNTD